MPTSDDPYAALLARLTAIYTDGLAAVSPDMQNQRTLAMHWNAGKSIVEDEQGGAATAKYGSRLLKQLAGDLSAQLRRSVSDRQLTYERKFYNEYEISHVRAKLTWTHYRHLLEVKSRRERARLESLAETRGLSSVALQQMVRELNEGRAAEPFAVPASAKKSLVPRDGRLHLVKVVSVREGEKTRQMADLGFRQICALPKGRPRKLQDGELLDWREDDGGSSVARTDCVAGQQYCYEGFIQSVIDGDTIVAAMQLASNRMTIQKLRLRGVNARELGSAPGEAAKVRVMELLAAGAPVRVLTYHWDMYGRYVADVFVRHGEEERFVNEVLRRG